MSRNNASTACRSSRRAAGPIRTVSERAAGDGGVSSTPGTQTLDKDLGRLHRPDCAVLMPCQKRARRIDRLEQKIDQQHVRPQTAGAQALQQGLHQMREFRDIGESEGCSAAPDRMRGPENRIELFIVAGQRIESKQTVLHAIEVFAGLVEKNMLELAHWRHSSSADCALSASTGKMTAMDTLDFIFSAAL
jgi:hypothetical protein